MNVRRPVIRAALVLALVGVLAIGSVILDRDSASQPATGPTTVRVVKLPGGGGWQYQVNGRPEWPIGIGYNPVYRYLSPDERLRRYRRDFTMFRENGISLLVLWTREKGAIQDEVDDLLLNTAAEFGLGAIIPFYFPPLEDYANPLVYEELRAQVTERVTRYRDHPALRIWGLGNEVLLELPIEQRRNWSRVFLRLADLIHQLDPDHPVMYRESEDLFVTQLISLFGRGGNDRPWLLYGMNVYTLRIVEIFDGWESVGIDRPLFINEFGPPFDIDYPNRARNYLAMWQAIRDRRHLVFGAAPYTWMGPGPDPYDGFYGLVGAETAQPLDNTWAALTAEFRKARDEDRPH